jgi:glycerol uptake facilitator-like aquaporin
MTLSRRLAAELLGTALLLAAVVGSGIMGDRLSGGNTAIALLANTIATGATLVTLIFTFGPISGAHFNPAVTLADASQRGLPWREVPGYIAAQLTGAILGVWTAHLMFGERVLQISEHARARTPVKRSPGRNRAVSILLFRRTLNAGPAGATARTTADGSGSDGAGAAFCTGSAD